jgi:hypothetical protein
MVEGEGDFNSMFADVSVPLRDMICRIISGSIRIPEGSVAKFNASI